MGCCLSKKPSPIPLSSVTSCDVNKSPDPVKPDDVNKPTKPVIELPVKPVIKLQENPEAKPTSISEEVKKEEENSTSKKTDSEAASKPVMRTSSCTKEEVDAILIQCGKLSQSNSTRRYSGSKRSFDFDQNDERRKTPQRVNGSPRERRRGTTPSKESEVSKSYRSRSRERGSPSPAKRSEATNSRGSLVNSSSIKFVTVPATNKNGEPSSSKRVTVKRSIGEACRTAASPAKAARSNVQPPPLLPSRKAEKSPYRRRTPLGEIDQNATKGDKKKMMIKRDNESAKPQVMSRSRSLRKSQDFETLLQSNEEDKSNYTALLLKDIKNFHGESHDNDDDDEDPLSLLPPCVTKACSIVDAVADLNSNTCLSSDLNRFRFTSDLMEPGFEKYVTVRRGCSLEEQESSCG